MKEKENCAGCAYVCSRAKNGEFPPCLTPPKREGIGSVDNWLSRQYMDFRALQDRLRWGDYDGCAYLRVNKKKLLDRYRTEWAKVNPKPIHGETTPFAVAFAHLLGSVASIGAK